jgi:cytochrome c oxidase subunit 2
MLAKVVVLDDAQWKAWNLNRPIGNVPEIGLEGATEESSGKIAASTQGSLVDQGKAVYENKGCVACHSVDGTTKVGPSHKGLFGKKEELADGRTVVVDENYIRNHIENPQANTVKGFQPVMPTFKGLISETEMNALIAYIKSLK